MPMTLRTWLVSAVLAANIAPTAFPADRASLSLAQRLADQGVREIIFALRPIGDDVHWYANFGYYCESETHVAYTTGAKLCRLDLETGRVTTILEDSRGGIRDPILRHDGKKILFSYRKGGTSYYHLHEVNLDGSGLWQLTDGPYDDIEPCYLPDGGIIFISTRSKRWVQCWLTQVATMHRCDAEGKYIHPISANIEQDNTPWPLPDGRILYQRWEYVDRSQVHYHHLWTANPDGTGEMVYYGNQRPGIVMLDAKPIPNTQRVVAVFSPGHGRREHDGVLTVVDPRRGPDEPSSAQPVRPEPDFRDPWAFSEDLFMAVQGGRIVLLDRSGRVEEIYHVSDDDARAGFECHEPRPIAPRPVEPAVPDRTDLQRETGELVLIDVYRGRNMAGVKRGEIKKLLVLETLPKPINFSGGMEPLTYGGSFTLERVLGTAPVEADGSASIELPALRPVFFVALDRNDMAVKRMQSFTTVQPGERTGCIGCHERRTATMPPTTQALSASRRPSSIEPVADCPDVFDFPRDIQPILDRLCADCHGYEKTARGGPYAGKVILTGDRGPMYSHSYYTMTAQGLFSDNRNRPVSELPPRALGSSASRIFQMLDGSHYGAVANDHERKLLRLWIDVGAPYPGTYAALGCGSIGSYAGDTLHKADWDWRTTRAGADVIVRRCLSCHWGAGRLPWALCDDRSLPLHLWGPEDPWLKTNRHIIFNLTRPEHSLVLLAPLAESAGGFALCRDAQGRPSTVFADTNDPDYKKLLAMVAAGRDELEVIKRFDMPGFRPNGPYLREMRRFGILPEGHPNDAPVDPYALDRRYWESLWYRAAAPPAGRGARPFGGMWRP
jgi:hypothetical protein